MVFDDFELLTVQHEEKLCAVEAPFSCLAQKNHYKKFMVRSAFLPIYQMQISIKAFLYSSGDAILHSLIRQCLVAIMKD